MVFHPPSICCMCGICFDMTVSQCPEDHFCSDTKEKKAVEIEDPGKPVPFLALSDMWLQLSSSG